jgi:hypothetical protein
MRSAIPLIAGLLIAVTARDVAATPKSRGIEIAAHPGITLPVAEAIDPVPAEILEDALVVRIPGRGELSAVKLPGGTVVPLPNSSALSDILRQEGRRVGPWKPARRSLPGQRCNLNVLLWADAKTTWLQILNVMARCEGVTPRCVKISLVARDGSGRAGLLQAPLAGCPWCSPMRLTAEHRRILDIEAGRFSDTESDAIDRIFSSVWRRRGVTFLAATGEAKTQHVIALLGRARSFGFSLQACGHPGLAEMEWEGRPRFFYAARAQEQADGAAMPARLTGLPTDNHPCSPTSNPVLLCLGWTGRIASWTPRRHLAAEDASIRWLKVHQKPDGSWDPGGSTVRHEFDPQEAGPTQSDIGATSLALLAILTTGDTHKTGRYRKTVRSGMKILVKFQKSDSALVSESGPDLHRQRALATLALTEVYRKTHSPLFQAAAQHGIDVLVRDRPAVRDAKTRAWILLAFSSARLGGLDVPAEAGLDDALREFSAPNDSTEWFFATLAAFRGGRPAWKPWIAKIRSNLLEKQRNDGMFCGSWDPIGPRRHERRRVEATALAQLCTALLSRCPDVVGIGEADSRRR